MRRNKYVAANRLFTILKWLDGGDVVNYRRICATFGVQREQAHDDVQFLQGFRSLTREKVKNSIHFTRGHGGQGARGFARAAALEFGRASLGILSGTIYEEHVKVFCEEIRPEVDPNRVLELQRVVASFHVRQNEASSLPDRHEVIEDILAALQYGCALWMEYHRLRDNTVVEYIVEPLALVLYREQLQMVGRKRSDGKIRSFDIDGIIQCKRQLHDRFERPVGIDIPALYAHSFGRYTNLPPVRVVLRIKGEAATFLRRRSIHPSQSVHVMGDEVRIELNVGLCPDLKSWIKGLIPDIHVEEPASLAEEIRTALEEGLSRL